MLLSLWKQAPAEALQFSRDLTEITLEEMEEGKLYDDHKLIGQILSVKVSGILSI